MPNLPDITALVAEVAVQAADKTTDQILSKLKECGVLPMTSASTGAPLVSTTTGPGTTAADVASSAVNALLHGADRAGEGSALNPC